MFRFRISRIHTADYDKTVRDSETVLVDVGRGTAGGARPNF